MRRYSKEVDKFIKEKILPELGYSDYNSDNIEEVINYISNEYNDLFALSDEDASMLGTDEKELLRLATLTLNELTDDVE